MGVYCRLECSVGSVADGVVEELGLRVFVGIFLERLAKLVGFSHFDEHFVLVLVLGLVDGHLQEFIHFLLLLPRLLEVHVRVVLHGLLGASRKEILRGWVTF